jgi:excisionase family DNA binding protein
MAESEPKKKPRTERQLWTPQEVSEEWSVSPETIYRLIRTDKIDFIRVSAKRYRIPYDQVLRGISV